MFELPIPMPDPGRIKNESLLLLIAANISVFSSVAFAQGGLQFVQSENASGLLYADHFTSTIGEIEPLLFAYSKMPAVGPSPGSGQISSYKFNLATQDFDLGQIYTDLDIQLDENSHIAISKRPSTSEYWLYVLSNAKPMANPAQSGKLRYAVVNSNGSLAVQPGFIEVSNATPGLQNVIQVVAAPAAPAANTSYLFTLTNQAGVNDGGIGVIGRSATGVASYIGHKTTGVGGVPLLNPKHLAVSPDGLRLVTVDDNSIDIFNFSSGTLTNNASIGLVNCIANADDLVLTSNPNEMYTSGLGRLVMLTKNGLAWDCPVTFSPAEWAGAEIKLSAGPGPGLLLASITRTTAPVMNRLSLVQFNGTSFSVLSNVDGPSFGNFAIKNSTRPALVVGANSNFVAIGNYGFPADPYGFNIFGFSDVLFRSGFE